MVHVENKGLKQFIYRADAGKEFMGLYYDLSEKSSDEAKVGKNYLNEKNWEQ